MKIEVGDHFIPLANSPRYGPKRWRMETRGSTRTFIEVELTPMDRLQSDLAGAGDFFEASSPVTEADAQAYPAVKEYVGGRAVFPKRLPYPPGNDPESTAIRCKSEDIWMAAYAEMEALQTITMPPDKPSDDNALTRKFQVELARGD